MAKIEAFVAFARKMQTTTNIATLTRWEDEKEKQQQPKEQRPPCAS